MVSIHIGKLSSAFAVDIHFSSELCQKLIFHHAICNVIQLLLPDGNCHSDPFKRGEVGVLGGPDVKKGERPQFGMDLEIPDSRATQPFLTEISTLYYFKKHFTTKNSNKVHASSR